MGRRILGAITVATFGTLLSYGAIAAATRPQVDPDPATATAPAPTPEAAVAQLVQATGAAYAGDCATTQSPDDAGKVCSRFVAERSDLRAYMLGRTFSEFNEWAFVKQVAGGWEPAGTAPQDPLSAGDEVPWPPE
jgi:hypothetical protein